MSDKKIRRSEFWRRQGFVDYSDWLAAICFFGLFAVWFWILVTH